MAICTINPPQSLSRSSISSRCSPVYPASSNNSANEDTAPVDAPFTHARNGPRPFALGDDDSHKKTSHSSDHSDFEQLIATVSSSSAVVSVRRTSSDTNPPMTATGGGRRTLSPPVERQPPLEFSSPARPAGIYFLTLLGSPSSFPPFRPTMRINTLASASSSIPPSFLREDTAETGMNESSSFLIYRRPLLRQDIPLLWPSSIRARTAAPQLRGGEAVCAQQSSRDD